MSRWFASRVKVQTLVEGELVDGRGYLPTFRFAEGSRWSKIIGKGNRKVVGFACLHCGNLQYQVQFTDSDRERLAKFDGPQPSVVTGTDAPPDEPS